MTDIDTLVAHNIEQIEKHGFVSTAVVGEDEPPWVYTTGISQTQHHPELVIYGLPVELAHGVIWSAFDLIKEGAGPLTPNTFVEGILQTYPVGIVKVDDVLDDDYPMNMTKHIYQGQRFEAVQLVWPDSEGRFPWAKKSKVKDQRLFGRWQPGSAGVVPI